MGKKFEIGDTVRLRSDRFEKDKDYSSNTVKKDVSYAFITFIESKSLSLRHYYAFIISSSHERSINRIRIVGSKRILKHKKIVLTEINYHSRVKKIKINRVLSFRPFNR